MNHPPGPGQYTIISGFLSEEDQQELCTQQYLQCYGNAAGDIAAQAECSRLLDQCTEAVNGDLVVTTDDWTECEQLVFNSEDSKGVIHEWAGIDDHYIDIFNENDDGFMVADIISHDSGTFTINRVSSKGQANGVASIKIFKAEGAIDFDQYVRKTGDTMTGNLQLNNQLNVDGKAAFKDRLAVLPNADSSSSSFIVYGRVDGFHDSPLLTATNNDWIRNIDDCVEYYGTSDSDDSIITKKFVEDNFVSKTGDTINGRLMVKPSTGSSAFVVYTSPEAQSGSYVSYVYGKEYDKPDGSGTTRDILFGVLASGTVKAGSNYTPQYDSHLTTKKYVDDAITSAPPMFGVPYKYRGDDRKAENLQPGEFFISDNKSLYLHYTDAAGRKILDSNYNVIKVDYEKNIEPKQSWGTAFIKIYTRFRNVHHVFRFKEVKTGNASNNYVRYLHYEEFKNAPDWSSGETYYLADGLFMPY